jgi:hypothetical protein
MSRQLEQHLEEVTKRRHLAVVAAVEYALVGSIERAGGELTGFSVKLAEGDCLLTLRVTLAGRSQVSFVGAEDLGSALIKAVNLGRHDKLKYRPSKF